MTSWFDAMLGGDSTSVCALMATKGQALKDVPKAVETCKTMVDPMLKTLEPVKDMLKDLDVKGATVNGDRANFENATTTPAMAAQLIKPFKAVKVKGKWYITE
ncbi:MAG: hypothetical protein L0H25_04185 [Micrococcales bacterium]|nr:hypothetical protein [Micrococcales bacterium]